MYTTEITKGVRLHALQTEKFSSITFCLLFRMPLKRENVTANSLLARVLLNGCGKYETGRSIEIRLEEINSEISTNVIKKGEEHIIEIFCKTIPTYIEEVCELMGDIIFNPLFNNIDSASKDLENTINSLVNDKRTYAFEKCIEKMCENEAYGINGDGYIKDINNVDIPSHYRNVMDNANIEIIAIGNIKGEEIREYITKYMPFFPRNTILEPCSYLYYPSVEKNAEENMDITQGKLCVGIRMNINPTSSDWYKAIVANELFGGSANSALFMEAREGESLCYYISSRLLRFKSIMIIEAGIDISNRDKVIKIIKSSFENISEENIETAKYNIINGYKIAEDKPERIMDNILGGIIAGKEQSIESAINGIEGVDTIKGIFDDSHFDTIFMLKQGGQQ